MVQFSTSNGELIAYLCSVVRRCCSQCSNIFSPETTGPIKAKLHVEQLSAGESKICINGQGHMTKMAALATNSKYF